MFKFICLSVYHFVLAVKKLTDCILINRISWMCAHSNILLVSMLMTEPASSCTTLTGKQSPLQSACSFRFVPSFFNTVNIVQHVGMKPLQT